MLLRRCHKLLLEPCELAHFDLSKLMSGETGVVSEMKWRAYTAHHSIELDSEDVLLLGSMSPTEWIDSSQVEARCDRDSLQRLLRDGLLICDDSEWAAQRELDEGARNIHWHGLAAAYHVTSRWESVDAAGQVEAAGLDTAEGLRKKYGVPPAMLHQRSDGGRCESLPRLARNNFDKLLDSRASCRNFDQSKPLPLQKLAQVLDRTFGEHGRVRGAEDFDVLKRTSPSGGALHPTECYLIVRNVEGLEQGLYHYRPGDHSVHVLPFNSDGILIGAERHQVAAGMSPVDYLSWIAVGGQQYFSGAHVLCILAPRFNRNFWKYRNHPKAYRVCILDVGHLSQTLLLSATEAGLGSYVTAAINEVEIERAFGLAHWIEGPLAVCGLGLRSSKMETYELDPNRSVWPR